MHEQLEFRREARPNYDGAFLGAYQKACERLDHLQMEHKLAPDQLSELLDLDRLKRERVLRSEPRFHSYSLATHALERCQQELSRNPTTAWSLARLGRTVVLHLDPRTCGGADAITDLEAYALAVEGNALRVCGHRQTAVRAFAHARIVQRKGGIDPDLTADIDLMESSLRRDLWQFDAALVLLDRATEVFVSLGEQDRVVRAVISRANVHIAKGEYSKAATILHRALKWPLDSDVILTVRHNLADALVKAGRAIEASQVFLATQGLYEQCADILPTSRRLWVEGLIARELGEDLHHAEELLHLATDNLMAKGYACDAALAELDLVVTRRKLKDSRRRARRKRLPNPLHARIAAAQQHADPAAAETAVGEGSGQAGGARRLHHHP
jgi:tetratricopeptide (TPR) repeat protein